MALLFACTWPTASPRLNRAKGGRQFRSPMPGTSPHRISRGLPSRAGETGRGTLVPMSIFLDVCRVVGTGQIWGKPPLRHHLCRSHRSRPPAIPDTSRRCRSRTLRKTCRRHIRRLRVSCHHFRDPRSAPISQSIGRGHIKCLLTRTANVSYIY